MITQEGGKKKKRKGCPANRSDSLAIGFESSIGGRGEQKGEKRIMPFLPQSPPSREKGKEKEGEERGRGGKKTRHNFIRLPKRIACK